MNQQPQNDMHEEAVVRRVAGNMAVVESVQHDACAHCGAKGACDAMGGGKARQVAALNQAGAKVDDRVEIAISRRAVMGAGALVYMVPVVAVIVGAVVGQKMGPSWGWDPTNAAVLLALGSLAVTWLIISRISRVLAGRRGFSVRIVRVLRKEQADAVDECAAGL